MRKLSMAALGAGVALVAGMAVAIAGTPFGGDDNGTVPDPSHKATLKCEQSIDKAVGKAVGCIGKCTASRASGKLADDTAEDACEKNNAGKGCLELFQAAAAKAQTKDTSGACNCVNAGTISTIIEAVLDGQNNTVYCDASSGTPFGGDDTGFIPVPKSPTAACEASVAKAVSKAVGCVIKCHASRASGKLADDAAEDACEKNNLGKSCLEKFQASVTKAQTKDTSGLCNCISGSGLAATIESQLDVNSGLVYCASPSGAFLN